MGFQKVLRVFIAALQGIAWIQGRAHTIMQKKVMKSGSKMQCRLLCTLACKRTFLEYATFGQFTFREQSFLN